MAKTNTEIMIDRTLSLSIRERHAAHRVEVERKKRESLKAHKEWVRQQRAQKSADRQTWIAEIEAERREKARADAAWYAEVVGS